MRRLIKHTLTAIAMLLAIGVSATWWAVRQTQYVPAFYAEATDSSVKPALKRRPHFKVKQQDDTSTIATWRANFSTNEINAWLAEELPKKFPELLAKGASEPRIVIDEDRVLAAARYRNRRFDLVISCELKVELTEQPNMLALRVQHLKAGALPLPLSKFVKGISKEAAKGDIDIRWDATESGPVALVSIPSEHPEYVKSPMIMESVELADNALVLAGQTGPLAHESYSPLGPVYRFVSYRPGEKRKRQASLPSKGKELSRRLR